MDGTVDLVLFNGKVMTLDRQNPEAHAIAIRGDRFVAAGTEQQELDKYLTNPPADVHGTTMVISAPNADDRQNVIAYLKTLK